MRRLKHPRVSRSTDRGIHTLEKLLPSLRSRNEPSSDGDVVRFSPTPPSRGTFPCPPSQRRLFQRHALSITRSSSQSPRCHFSAKNRQKEVRSIDPVRISALLVREDWFSMLDAEIESIGGCLDPQLVVRVLRCQENPLLSLKFYLWVSHCSAGLMKERSVRSALLDVLLRKGPVVLTVELLEDLRSSGCQFTEDCFCVLLGSWGRLGLARYVLEIFGQMSFLELRPSTRVYNAVIDALVKSNSLDLAYFKFQQMPSDNCYPDRFTYNMLIHGVCKRGIVDEALRLLKQMEGSGYAPNVFTYTMLVDGFCKAKKIDEALQVLEMMRKNTVHPSDATYRTLVHGIFQCSSPAKAYSLLTELMEKEPVLHENACRDVLYCLSKRNMSREMREFLSRMDLRGYLPDSGAFGIIMPCHIRSLHLTEACCIFDDFLTRGGKPSFDTYHMLILALLKEGRVKDGRQRVSEMISSGIVCSVVSFNILIDCFSKAKLMEEALEIFAQMLQHGYSPSLISFNTLISGYSKVGDVNKTRELLKMLLLHGFKPDIFTFSSIIDGLCRAYQIEDAFSCFAEMNEWGISPNAVVYNLMIRSLCASGQVSKAMKLFMKMKDDGISPDGFSFNALVVSFCKMKMIRRAQNLFESMMRFGITPDNHTCDVFIKSLCDAKKIDEASEIIQAIEACGYFPESHLYAPVADALLSLGKVEEVNKLVQECAKKGIHINFGPDLNISAKNDA